MSSLHHGAQAPIQPGDVVCGRYRVDAILGAGAFGWVVSATHESSGARVALKVLRPEQAAAGSIMARFVRRELEILRRVHERGPVPQVVRALEPDILEERGLFFLVLELVDGPSLAEVIATEKLLDQAEARRILSECAAGLAAIHAAEGVHRDVKPENIRLRATGEAVLLDLGIAKALWTTARLTQTTERPMTPVYAAPEQLAGEEVGPPADVYSLGLIGYEMLTGAVPLSGRTLTELLMTRVTSEPPDVRSFGRPVSDDMVAILRACLDRSPANRPTAATIAHALQGGPAAHHAVGLAATVYGSKSLPPAPAAPTAPSADPRAFLRTDVSAAQSGALAGASQTAPSAFQVSGAGETSAPRQRRAWPWLVLAGVAAAGAAGVFAMRHRAPSLAERDPTPPVSASAAPEIVDVRSASPSASASVTEAPPPPSLRVTLLEEKVKVGNPIVARLEATAPLHVLILDVYEAGDGALLTPSAFKRDLVVSPGEVVFFPPDKYLATATLLPGMQKTREAYVAFGFLKESDVEALVPTRAYGEKMTPLDKAAVLRIEEAARKAGAIEASAPYVIHK